MRYEHFRRQVTLRDGVRATIRPLVPADRDGLFDMFRSLSARARRFLYDDVTDLGVVERWTRNIDYERVLPLVVESEGRILADGTLHRREAGPFRHVARMRVVVRDGQRGRGIGTVLARELVEIARTEGKRVVMCQLAEFAEDDAIEAMKALHFHRTAVLPEFLIDPDGKTHALTIMSRRLDADAESSLLEPAGAEESIPRGR